MKKTTGFYENKFDGFMEVVADTVRDLLPLEPEKAQQTKLKINSTINALIQESKARHEVLKPFDGLLYTGVKTDFVDNNVVLRWETDFFPWARYKRQHGNCQPLGWFEEYDLYVCRQDPLPPTLVARHGNSPESYLTFNPSLQGVGNIALAGKHFEEALKRAAYINFDLGVNVILDLKKFN